MSLQHSLPFPCGQPAALTPVAGEWYSRVGDWELGVQAATVAVTDFRLGYKHGEMFSNHPSTQPFVSVYVCVSLSWSMLWLLVLATPRVPGRPHEVCLLLSASQFLLTYPSNPSIFLWCLQTAKSCSCMRQTCYRNQNPLIEAFVFQQSLG